jgi:hypothetical protein
VLSYQSYIQNNSVHVKEVSLSKLQGEVFMDADGLHAGDPKIASAAVRMDAMISRCRSARTIMMNGLSCDDQDRV